MNRMKAIWLVGAIVVVIIAVLTASSWRADGSPGLTDLLVGLSVGVFLSQVAAGVYALRARSDQMLVAVHAALAMSAACMAMQYWFGSGSVETAFAAAAAAFLLTTGVLLAIYLKRLQLSAKPRPARSADA